jgi:predicted DNA-binding ribbon-helix-helix protein
MLYVIRTFGNNKFVPLTGEDVTETHSIEINGVAFSGLNKLQYSVLKEMADEHELKAQEVLTNPTNE